MPHVLCGVGVSVLAAARPRPPITAPLAAAAGRARAAAIFRPGLRGRRATAAGPGGRASPCYPACQAAGTRGHTCAWQFYD